MSRIKKATVCSPFYKIAFSKRSMNVTYCFFFPLILEVAVIADAIGTVCPRETH